MNGEIAAGSPSSDETAESRNLGQVVAAISRRLSADLIGAGDMAALRHMTADGFPPAFWKLYLTDVPLTWREPGGRVDERLDGAWAALVRAMVEMAPNPHTFDQPFGAALAHAGYSEDRFVRLLRAAGDDLTRELRVAGARLARAGAGATNWEQPAHLVLGDTGCKLNVWPPRIRHQMARDYFRAVAKQSPSQ